MKKKYHRIKLGAWGEGMAEKYLIEKGCAILAKNLKVGRGELDILAWKDDVLLVVEVKTKSTKLYGEPAEEVDERKVEQIYNLVDSLLKDTDLLHKIGLNGQENWQIDIISVYGDGRRLSDIIHYENVGVWG